ncbi:MULTISPECIES: calcium/sodium antiporter [Virgibacillus]|jgi:cation:H+ antiporter|uniref:Calcium/sodium antiporter n=1 Tax=Virgibacillus halodenitrificans TaxID=1482 RepID=A0AAC9IX33_VIRHA|nr:MULTISPECIES: calcium/sodium antiporter [Virgibacillus]AIF42224.1 K+-dependent Na+/Ca+ exchanger [Virgibacillus sp. SK37]APC46938.1 sodium:proton exchanger [Virgibacillus halodenitrificans]MBD1222973.1 calcium/sodium antiporter [Virgibacillus halodenitrificans]MCG1027469.1 calcium/sodium antiporter [Virgibacillus halodenitrificans]MCJ0930233.1 calcium/sodium antiporter [Virgibacillus halodenitrificans]
MAYFLLLIGFVLLIKGADLFVDGSSNIARLLRVSPMLIGLTIVALGTSSPEATVSIIAALEGSSEVSLGNVIGSNIFNLTLVVGIAAILYPLKVESETVRKEIPFTLLASIALLVLISDIFLEGVSANFLTRSDGIIFLLFLSIFMYYVIEVGLRNRDNSEKEVSPDVKWPRNILFTVLGIVGIIIGGDMVVSNGTTIAYSLGMSETLVGLTIIAVGTSLPELVTSITAAMKKESEIALGNIVGSNIFNILFVLGASSAITPLPVNNKVFIDITVMIVLTLLLLLFSRTSYKIGKVEGSVLVIIYVVYLAYIIFRN